MFCSTFSITETLYKIELNITEYIVVNNMSNAKNENPDHRSDGIYYTEKIYQDIRDTKDSEPSAEKPVSTDRTQTDAVKTTDFIEIDYIKEGQNLLAELPLTAPIETINGYDNGNCYGCDLMMKGCTKVIHPHHHTCLRRTN